jgi:hypothetical protein
MPEYTTARQALLIIRRLRPDKIFQAPDFLGKK